MHLTPTAYDPFADLATRYPEITVAITDLDEGVHGHWFGKTLHLNSVLTDAERRSALAGEIGHLDGGETLGALVPAEHLGEALREVVAANLHQIAERLDVDAIAIRNRLTDLSSDEVAVVTAAAFRA